MLQQGEYSTGKLLGNNISSDLCIPIGLILPAKYEFIVENEHEIEPIDCPSIEEKKMAQLLNLILHPVSKKRRTRKNRVREP